nr:MAG TPA: hypothetical protein [Caudoviricetes sp.]
MLSKINEIVEKCRLHQEVIGCAVNMKHMLSLSWI